MTGDWVIELHNEALATDGDYAAEYFSAMEDLDAAVLEIRDELEIDFFPEYKLAFDGYQEFGNCELCNEPFKAPGEFHKDCFDAENAWYDMQNF